MSLSDTERGEMLNLGQKIPKKITLQSKVDIDNNLEALFKEPNNDELHPLNFEDVDDPDATPKLEKKASMSHIIYNLKSKFGSASARKKGKAVFFLFERNMF